jgi:hypothetical protein
MAWCLVKQQDDFTFTFVEANNSKVQGEINGLDIIMKDNPCVSFVLLCNSLMLYKTGCVLLIVVFWVITINIFTTMRISNLIMFYYFELVHFRLEK